jgi:hypothetical protein
MYGNVSATDQVADYSLDSATLDEIQHFRPARIHVTSEEVLPSLCRLFHQVRGNIIH